MLVESGNGISISTLFNNELVTLNDSENWNIWLKRVRDLSDIKLYDNFYIVFT